MPDENGKTFATQLPADEARVVEEALRETDITKVELLRRAVRYYRRHNPDHVAALYPEGSFQRKLAEDVR